MWMIGPNDTPKRLIVDKFTKAEFQSIIPPMSRQYQRTRKISLTSPIRHIYFNDHRGTPTRARKRH